MRGASNSNSARALRGLRHIHRPAFRRQKRPSTTTDNAKPIYEKLEWGHGPRILDVFLEPTCPFCTLAFGKLKPLLDQAGEDRIEMFVISN
ncbi:Hypothetical protein NGAL_HAMBI2610_50800 [Neorhizobium galegae bv. orientalis]|nr:Hypothetical protein NGAL_HAMBI2610_50800 [Neorhizobium galegae bv. orientalis]